jgi:hypothetical protein
MSLAQDYIAACLAQDQNLAPAFRQAFAPQQFRSSLGWNRVFLSANDARQYRDDGNRHNTARQDAMACLRDAVDGLLGDVVRRREAELNWGRE